MGECLNHIGPEIPSITQSLLFGKEIVLKIVLHFNPKIKYFGKRMLSSVILWHYLIQLQKVNLIIFTRFLF